jgi:hypothetical protein
MILDKILGVGMAGSLLFCGVQTIRLHIDSTELRHRKEVIQSLTAWRDDMVTTIRLASGNTKVDPDTARPQVVSMGNALVSLNTALGKQNDAVAALTQQKAEAEARADAEAKKRAAAIARADDLASQLDQSALKPVNPQDMEAEVRRAQDLTYEAGL